MKRTIDDVDFKLGKDGELELSGFDEGDEFDFLEDEEEDVDDVEEDEEEEEVAEKPAKGSGDMISLATRIGSIEATLQNLPNLIAQSISGAMGKKQEEEEEIPDELDPKQIVSILSKRIDKAVEASVNGAMKQHAPALTQASVTAAFQNAAATHGQVFIDNMPLVSKIMLKSNGQISVDQAWEIVKDSGMLTVKKKIADKQQILNKSKKVDADSEDSVSEPRAKFVTQKGKNDSETFDNSFNKAILKSISSTGKRKTA